MTKVAGKKSSKATASTLADLMHEFVEKAKLSGSLTYDEVIEFSTENQLNEKDAESLLRTLDKEHVELITQDEADAQRSGFDDFDAEEFTIHFRKYTEFIDAFKVAGIPIDQYISQQNLSNEFEKKAKLAIIL